VRHLHGAARHARRGEQREVDVDADPDPAPFAGQFAAHPTDRGVIVIPNLGGDAFLVVPRPIGPGAAYTHIAAFVRGAPTRQQDALWRAVATAVLERLSPKLVWLSTAGAGVAWLHVRLDEWPKYYAYAPYRAGPRVPSPATGVDYRGARR